MKSALLLALALVAAPALAVDVQTHAFLGELRNYSSLTLPDHFEGTVRETFEDGRLVSVSLASNLGAWFTTAIHGAEGSWSASLYLDDCLGVGFYQDAVYLSNSSPVYTASAHWASVAAVPEPELWLLLALGAPLLALRRRARRGGP